MNNAILDGGHAEGPELSRLATLGNHHAPHGGGKIATRPQPFSQIPEETFDPDTLLDALHRHLIHPSRASATIARDTPPREPEVARAGKPAPHILPGFAGMISTPRVELALNVEEPGCIRLFTGVHRCFPLWQTRQNVCSPSPCGRLSRPRTTTGAPSPPAAIARLRRACRRGEHRRRHAGSCVPIVDPWTL